LTVGILSHLKLFKYQTTSIISIFSFNQICTELLGRGIDFKGVNMVINYDFPSTTASYIHRIGRTGRAGRPGKAVTFFTQKDATLLRSVAQIIKTSGGEVPEYMLKMKKATKQEKRYLAKNEVKRERISRESKYDREKRERKQRAIEKTKRLKKEGKLGQNESFNAGMEDSDQENREFEEDVDKAVKKKKKKVAKSKIELSSSDGSPKKKFKKKKKKVEIDDD